MILVLYTTLTDHVEAARFKEAEAIVEKLRGLEKDFSGPWPERHRAVLATAQGEWEEAQRLCTLRPGVPLGSAAQVVALIQYETLLMRGGWKDLENLARWSANLDPSLMAWQIGLGRVLSMMGRGEEMRADFERWTDDRCACVPRDFNYIPTITQLAEICHELDDNKTAQMLYELLTPYRDRMIVLRVLAVLRGPVTHCLARLATTRGDFERARVDFDSARAMADAAGVRPHLAWIEYNYARMLVREGNPSSQARIAELATSSAVAARDLGMAWLAPRAAAIVATMAG